MFLILDDSGFDLQASQSSFDDVDREKFVFLELSMTLTTTSTSTATAKTFTLCLKALSSKSSCYASGRRKRSALAIEEEKPK